MIGSNQEKTAALEKSVVQAADAQAFSAGETAKQTAEKIAGDAQSQSIAISNSQTAGATQTSSTQSFSGPGQNNGLPLQGNLQSNTMVNSARLDQSMVGTPNQNGTSNSAGNNQQNNQGGTKQDSGGVSTQFVLQSPKYEAPKSESMGIQTFSQGQYQPPVIKQETVVTSITPISSYSLTPPTRQSQIQIEMPTIEGLKFGHKGPVENAIDARPLLHQMNAGSQQSDTVKKNVQNNELAGGVSIESIARQPANYAQYFVMIPDVAFYEPKEIYKNQKTIDNARALRSLSSDRLHQEMINQQYRLGN